MAKYISDMNVQLKPDLGASAEALAIWKVWYEIADDTDVSYRKRAAFLLTGEVGTNTCDASFAAAITQIKSAEGIV